MTTVRSSPGLLVRSIAIGAVAGLLFIACGDNSTAPVTHVPAIVSPAAGDQQQGPAGAPLPDSIVVRVTSAAGQPVPDIQVEWRVTVGGGSVSPGTSATDASGLARAEWTLGTALGANRLEATVPGVRTQEFRATGVVGPPAQVDVTPAHADIPAGSTQQFHASARDAAGNAIQDADFVWSTSDATLATVDPDGLVAGLAMGSVVVTATAGTAEGTASATITAPAPLVVLGDTVVVRQTWESDDALQADGGMPPFQWSVAPGAMPPGLELATDGAVTGTPSAEGLYTVRVQVEDALGTQAEGEVPITVCEAPRELAVGESLVWHAPAQCAIALADTEGARYQVGVTATAAVLSGRSEAVEVPFGLSLHREARGVAPGAAVMSMEVPRHVHPPDDALDEETLQEIRLTEAYHRELREQELREFANAIPNPAPGPLDPTLERQAQDYVPEQNRSFFASNPHGSGRIQVQATLRAMTDEILYYEDDTVIGTGYQATDHEVRRILDYYTDYGNTVIEEVFGGLGPVGTTDVFLDGPRMTHDLDGNGRFIILQLGPDNIRSGISGYVSSCDRRPRPENRQSGSACTDSNEAEITYIRRPDRDRHAAVVVHEAKHISSHGWAIYGGRDLNPSWIEEGTADIAKELSSRLAAGFDLSQELRYADLYPAGSTPTLATTGMAEVHSRARRFLSAAPMSSILGNPEPNVNNSHYYGASWLFHRYLADAYSGGDVAAFFRDMNTLASGVQTLEEATGRTLPELMVEFMQAVAVEGEPARELAPNRFTSYDFADVAARFAGGPWPYSQGSTSFSSGSFDFPTFYMSANYFTLTGVTGVSQGLSLLTMDGRPVHPSTEGALIVTRVQ